MHHEWLNNGSTDIYLTVIFSVDYKDTGKDTGNVTKQSLSSHQVVTKLSSSIPMICDLLEKMISPMSAKEMRQFCGLNNLLSNGGLNGTLNGTDQSVWIKRHVG